MRTVGRARGESAIVPATNVDAVRTPSYTVRCERLLSVLIEVMMSSTRYCHETILLVT